MAVTRTMACSLISVPPIVCFTPPRTRTESIQILSESKRIHLLSLPLDKLQCHSVGGLTLFVCIVNWYAPYRMQQPIVIALMWLAVCHLTGPKRFDVDDLEVVPVFTMIETVYEMFDGVTNDRLGRATD